MKILIDATYITEETWYKSLSVYLFRFLDSIREENHANFVILVLSEVKEKLRKQYPNIDMIDYAPYSMSFSGNRVLKYVRRCRLYKRIVESSGCDALFVPNDLIMFTAIKTWLKKTVVIHDMKSINERSKLSVLYWVFWFYYYFLIRNADHVIAISNYTKDDIIRYFPKLKQEKVKVVYNSVVIKDLAVEGASQRNSDYLLYVNALLPYKNVKTLIKAYALIKDEILQKLVVVGQKSDYWESEIVPLIKQETLEDRILQIQDISEEYLIKLYQNADLFVTTSLKEGFGYTPIEAAMCCCPVISTKCEALQDTTRDMLYYYSPPTDENALANQILSVLKNPPSLDKLKFISEEYKRVYSQEAQTKSLLEIIQS